VIIDSKSEKPVKTRPLRGDSMSNIVNVIALILFLLCWILIIRKFIVSRCATVKTVKAKIVDKYKPDIVSKYPGTFKRERYIVIFATKDKKLSFDVSEFSYGNYKINEKGTLKYKGNKIISFK